VIIKHPTTLSCISTLPCEIQTFEIVRGLHTLLKRPAANTSFNTSDI